MFLLALALLVVFVDGLHGLLLALSDFVQEEQPPRLAVRLLEFAEVYETHLLKAMR